MSGKNNKSKKGNSGSKTDLPDMKTNSDTKANTANLQKDKRHIDNI